MSDDGQLSSWAGVPNEPQWAPAPPPPNLPGPPPPSRGPRRPGFGSIRLNRITYVALAAVTVAGLGFVGWRTLSSSDSPAAGKTPTPTPTGKASPPLLGWKQALHPVTAPVAVGGRIVVYTADNGVLTIRGIDPTTGKTVWSHPASPSFSTPGQSFEVTHDEATVYYYAPVAQPNPRFAQLVAADAASGKPKWTSPQARPFIDMPALCSDKQAVCATAYNPASKPPSSPLLRFRLTDGVPTILSTQAGRKLGVGIEDPGSRSPEFIEHVSDTTGKVIWKDAVTQLAGSPVTSDSGWNWDSYGDVYVGWLAAKRGSSKTLTLAHEQTIGVRASDGKRLWKSPGMYGCPVQGLTDNGRAIPVRCLVAGTIAFSPSGGAPSFTHLAVTMQGFDVHTGKTTWTVPLGNAPAALGGIKNGVVRISGHVFAITDAAGKTVVIDLATGKTSAPAAGTTGWCLKADQTWDWANAAKVDGHARKYVAGGLAAPCTLDGKSGKPQDGSAAGVGASAGGWFVWSEPDGVRGVKTG